MLPESLSRLCNWWIFKYILFVFFLTNAAEVLEVQDDVEEDEYKSAEQIADELVTLSLLPTSKWLNLLSLDVIKVNIYQNFTFFA